VRARRSSGQPIPISSGGARVTKYSATQLLTCDLFAVANLYDFLEQWACKID